jgi:CRP-like cAMP-binding protein
MGEADNQALTDQLSRNTIFEGLTREQIADILPCIVDKAKKQEAFSIEQDGEIVYLSGDFFLSPCSKACSRREEHQEIVRNMLRLLSDRTLMLNKKIHYLTAPDLKTKVAMYLCELYDACGSASFNMPLNRDRLAEFFSVARPSLSREFINLTSMGVIDFYRSGVTIFDIEKLRKIAANRE